MLQSIEKHQKRANKFTKLVRYAHWTAERRYVINPTKDTILRKELREKIIEVCDLKIEKKGAAVGLSFYAFFKNKNDQPEVLMEAARWWIETHKLDHFEKAVKIKDMVLAGV